MVTENLTLKISKEIFNKREIGSYLYINPNSLEISFLKNRTESSDLIYLGRPFPKANTSNHIFFEGYDINKHYCSHRMFTTYIFKLKNRCDEEKLTNIIYSHILNTSDNSSDIIRALNESSLDLVPFLRFSDTRDDLELKNIKILTELSFASTTSPKIYKFFGRFNEFIETASLEDRLTYMDSPYVSRIKLFGSGYKIVYKEEALKAVNDFGMNLRYASKFNDDEEVVRAAVLNGKNTEPFALLYASDRLRDDPNFVLEVCQRNKHAITHASQRLNELCSDEDPVSDLEKIIEKTNLNNDLKNDLNQSIGNTNSRKLKI